MSDEQITIDRSAGTLTASVRCAASAERAWQLVADPRQLERWWGPPEFPATVSQHTLEPGGRVDYAMTGPDGERFPAWWDVVEVSAPRRLVVRDNLADDADGEATGLPSSVLTIEFADDGDGTLMTLQARFASPADLEQMLEVGMEEGMSSALSQVDAVLTT